MGRQPPGAFRAPAPRHAGANRHPVQRYPTPAGLCPAGRNLRPRDIRRRPNVGSRRTSDLRRPADAALGRTAFLLPEKQRLPAILAESRKYQNLVSTKLAEQVLAALYELLRGFQAANDQRHGELLSEVLADDPNHVYGGLLTVLLRLVFLLYAEDRSLLSNDEVYQNFYSVTGLFERLREDAGRYTDTMDHRYGAWAQLLTLFRLIYNGGRHAGMRIPAAEDTSLTQTVIASLKAGRSTQSDNMAS